MRFFYCLIFLSCVVVKDSFAIDDNNYILCTSHCQKSTISFSEPSTFSKECQSDDNANNIQAYASVCHIEYTINYDSQLINVIFQALNDTNVFEGQKTSEYLIQEINIGLTSQSHQTTAVKRKYSCNTNSDCAREFYLDNIHYLISDVGTKLDSIKRKLYNDTLQYGDSSQRRCRSSTLNGKSKARRCGNGLCYVHIENSTTNAELSNKVQKCDQHNEQFLYSFIESRAPTSGEYSKETLEYRCNKNVCNRDDMISKIQNIINEITSGPSSKPELQPSIETKTNSCIKQTIATYVVVLFLSLTQLLV